MGGEAVFKKDVDAYKKYFPDQCLFVNGLGPTESTVTLQYFIDKNTEISKEAVPVGFPADGTDVLLLAEDDREVQGYGVGEIVYKSDHLALGYLNNREKTGKSSYSSWSGGPGSSLPEQGAFGPPSTKSRT